MAYSMFTRPKLHNAKSVKYYPEHEYPVDQNYHFHDFQHNREDEISVDTIRQSQNNINKGTTSLKAKVSTNDRKCPIYVHQFDPDSDATNNFSKVNRYLNDLRSVEEEPNIASRRYYQSSQQISKKPDRSKKAVISKIEESYWANWKPSKSKSPSIKPERVAGFKSTKTKLQPKKHKLSTSKKVDYDGRAETMIELFNEEKPTVIKHFASMHYNEDPSCQSLSDPATSIPTQRSVDSQKIQTDFSVRDAETLSRIDEELTTTASQALDRVTNLEEESISCALVPYRKREIEDTESEIVATDLDESVKDAQRQPDTDQSMDSVQELIDEDTTFNSLKHTDSFILTKKKQKEDRPRYQQPKCIRLYKKPMGGAAASTSFIKGGTYPLKSCLKKDSSYYGKRNIRLGRPGSPLIVSSNCYNFPKQFKK